MKVFLGGTCNGSHWRDELIQGLRLDWFDPVVEHWTPDCRAEEIRQREQCDFCLYVITPKMRGFFSIAEVVEDSIRRPAKTLFCVLMHDGDTSFTRFQQRSLLAVGDMVQRNTGRPVFTDLASLRDWLNQQAED